MSLIERAGGSQDKPKATGSNAPAEARRIERARRKLEQRLGINPAAQDAALRAIHETQRHRAEPLEPVPPGMPAPKLPEVRAMEHSLKLEAESPQAKRVQELAKKIQESYVGEPKPLGERVFSQKPSPTQDESSR